MINAYQLDYPHKILYIIVLIANWCLNNTAFYPPLPPRKKNTFDETGSCLLNYSTLFALLSDESICCTRQQRYEEVER